MLSILKRTLYISPLYNWPHWLAFSQLDITNEQTIEDTFPSNNLYVILRHEGRNIEQLNESNYYESKGKIKNFFMTNNEKGQTSMDYSRVNKPEGGRRKNLRCIPCLLLIIKKFPKYFRVYFYIFSKNNKSLCSSLFHSLLPFSPDIFILVVQSS
jgi:hypothetical protein